METHAGYMAGMQKEFARSCSMPYYATSSEEVLFHVATRMTYKLEQKVREGREGRMCVWRVRDVRERERDGWREKTEGMYGRDRMIGDGKDVRDSGRVQEGGMYGR